MPFSCFKKTPSSVETENATQIENYGNRKDSFFVLTTIFNPASFKSRYELYHQFAQHMAQTGAQLITIECIFPELGQHEFQVTSPTNPCHIQLKSKSIYWMKENLINIAASRLPTKAKWICWLDADIHFEDRNWIELTIEQLKKYTVVQVFKKCKFLGPQPERKVLRVDYSFGYSVVHGKPIDQKRYDEWYPHPGYGWATSAHAFRHMNGLPEYDILGSADLHFAFSLIKKVSNAIESNLTLEFANLILDQSNKTYTRLAEARWPGAPVPVPVGYVPITIYHNWHGAREDRQYVDRWKILIAHRFNFLRDMRRTKEGLFEFVSGREALQQDILDHFRLRREDRREVEAKVKKAHRKEEWTKQKPLRSGSPSRRQFYTDSAVMAAAVYPYYEDPSNDEHHPPHDEWPCYPHPPGSDCPCPPVDYGACETEYSSGGYVDNYGGTVVTSSYY